MVNLVKSKSADNCQLGRTQEAPICSRARTAMHVLFGALITSVVISLLDYVQGLVLADWSGLHPIYRLGLIPIWILLAIGAAVVISTAAFLLRYPPLKTRAQQILFGAACGLVSVGTLLGPWISYENAFFLFVYAIVLLLNFWLRIRLVRAD